MDQDLLLLGLGWATIGNGAVLLVSPHDLVWGSEASRHAWRGMVKQRLAECDR